MQLDIVIDDLAFVPADAIARPVNGELRAATALMRRLEQAAGDALLRQLHVHEPLDVGAAVVTGAGALEAKLMIHAVVMTEDEAVTRHGVGRAMTGALQRARDWKLARVAFAPFGLGAGNLDVDEAAQAMVAALQGHQSAAYPQEVVIVVENEMEAAAFEAARAWFGRAA